RVEPGRAVRVDLAVLRTQEPGGHAQHARLAGARGARGGEGPPARPPRAGRRAAGRPGDDASQRAARPTISPPLTSLTESRIAADTATSTADRARAESKSVDSRS